MRARTLFEPLTTRLDGYRLLGLDWRGHGESKAADADFGTAELVEDALDVLEHAGVDRVVPVSAGAVVDQVTRMWMPDVDVPAITVYVQSMAAFPDDMWAWAARAISKAFEEHGSPLDAVVSLDPPPPTLHLYVQLPAREYLEAQRSVAAERPWFAVEHLEATSHFPVFEVPDVIADRIDRFVRS